MIFEAAYIFCIEVWARMFVENFVAESDFCRWGGFFSTDRISVECRFLDISIDNLFCHRIIFETCLFQDSGRQKLGPMITCGHWTSRHIRDEMLTPRNVSVFEGGYVIRSRLYKTENKVLMSEEFKGPFSKDIVSIKMTAKISVQNLWFML